MASDQAVPAPGASVEQAAALPVIECRGIRLLLLDIEGTTCPVDFVSGTLFPYAARTMAAFLERHAATRPDVQRLLEASREAWKQDRDPEAARLRNQHPEDLLGYLQLLIQQDRKLPALKELQGLLWEAGYDSGELIAPLFADVQPALHRWKQLGLTLAVYSSGSVMAQKLLYRHSTWGDLSTLFEHWFDTAVGPKHQSSSYSAIAAQLELPAREILFISDAVAECRAASVAGMAVLFSDRPGNPGRDACGFRSLSSFGHLVLRP
ncbi:MAG: acireductone synthase [Cyanobacteria bacterium J06638_7]